MDSKVLIKAMAIVTLFVAMMFVVILLVNGYGTGRSKKKDLFAEPSSEEDIAEEDGMIKGSNLYAWMQDETFFDEVKVGNGKYENGDGENLVISASSVEKDLRIRIMDSSGKLVKGKLFEVLLGGTTEYEDSDMDGVIHISDLSPGDYDVQLAEAAGYIVPERPLRCTVKAKVDYKAIADISYLIKTEAEIDVAKEDTAENNAITEDGESPDNAKIKTVDGARFGIDVSKYQGVIDWNDAKKDGVQFAIIRCGYRGSSTGAIVEDPYFRTNMEGAIGAGIPVGVYFFTQAVNNVEAVEEASAVMELVSPYKLTYPIFIDTEGAGGKGRADKLEVIDRSFAVQTFCETIRTGGYTAGIYASKNWFNNRLDVTKLSADNVTWLAEYKDKPTYGGTYQMWQYSSSGKVSGIEGRVDMNLSYLDVAN